MFSLCVYSSVELSKNRSDQKGAPVDYGTQEPVKLQKRSFIVSCRLANRFLPGRTMILRLGDLSVYTRYWRARKELLDSIELATFRSINPSHVPKNLFRQIVLPLLSLIVPPFLTQFLSLGTVAKFLGDCSGRRVQAAVICINSYVIGLLGSRSHNATNVQLYILLFPG